MSDPLECPVGQDRGLMCPRPRPERWTDSLPRGLKGVSLPELSAEAHRRTKKGHEGHVSPARRTLLFRTTRGGLNRRERERVASRPRPRWRAGRLRWCPREQEAGINSFPEQ